MRHAIVSLVALVVVTIIAACGELKIACVTDDNCLSAQTCVDGYCKDRALGDYGDGDAGGAAADAAPDAADASPPCHVDTDCGPTGRFCDDGACAP